MKKFLEDVNALIGQLGNMIEPTRECLEKIKVSYGRMNRNEQKESIRILSEILKEDYNSYYFLMSHYC